MTITKNIVVCLLLVAGTYTCAMEENKYQRALAEHEWDQFREAWYAAEEEDRQRLGMTKDEYISYRAQCIVDKDLEQCRARRKRLEIEEAERQKAQKK